MEDLSSDDPSSQSMPLGSVFIAIAIVVWTSVAIWLCYSGPPGNDAGADADSDLGDGTGDLPGGFCKGFTELLLDGKDDQDKTPLGSQCDARSLDLFKLEELLSPAKGDCKASSLKKSFLGKDGRLPSCGDRQGLLNKVTGSSMAKGLLSKVAGSGLKDGNGHFMSGLSGLSLGGDKDGLLGCDPRSTPSPARAPGDLEGSLGRTSAVLAGLDDEVSGDRQDFAGFREQLRDKLSASLHNGSRKPADPLDLGPLASPARSRGDLEVDALDFRVDRGVRGMSGVASAKREALEDFLKQLLHPPGPGRGDEKTLAGRVRGKLAEGGDYDEKEVNTRPATMLSMAEHAREVGNKYLQDRHFAAATHCYEVACLLYPMSASNTASSNGSSSVGISGVGPAEKLGSGIASSGTTSASGSPGQLAAYHCNCALACLELGRYGDAINEGNAALVLTPPKHIAVKALYRLAVAHINLKNAFEARRCLNKCLDFDPLNEYVRSFLARLGDEEVNGGGNEHQLVWIDPPKKVQCLGAAAREKARGRKAKQKGGGGMADEPSSLGCANNCGLQGCSGKDTGSCVGSTARGEVRLDREAALWHSMARHNNKLYILGGWSDGVVPPGALGSTSSPTTNGHVSEPGAHGSDELHVFDVDTFELRQLSGPNSKPPHPCYCHTATMVGSSMIVFGGCGPPADQPAAVMVFDVQQAKWRVPQTAGVPPRQRQGHSASAVQGERHLCIFGGIEPTEQHRVARVYNDAHLLDLQTYTWRKLEVGGYKPPARFGHTATSLPGQSGKLLIVGGRDHLGGSAGSLSGGFTGLHILDTERRAWSQQPFSGTPPLQAFYHNACVIDDTTILYLASGTAGNEDLNGNGTLPLHLLDLEAWHWSSPRASGLGPAPHIGHTATLVGNRVYMFGGVAMRGGQPVADKAIHILDTSQARPTLPTRVVEQEKAQVERAKGEKIKGDAHKATAPAVSSVSSTVVIEKTTSATTVSSVPTSSTASTRAAASTATSAVNIVHSVTNGAGLEATVIADEHRDTHDNNHHRSDKGSLATAVLQNTSLESPGHCPTVVDKLVSATVASGTTPRQRANGTASRTAGRTTGDSNHSHHVFTTSNASASQNGGGRPGGAGRQHDEKIAMMLGDSEEGEFEDDVELSFEELLEQEKAFFKAQSEKNRSFPRPKEGGGGGGGKKGHRY